MPTLQQLRYFRELARTQHLTRTAEALFITQTTLSNTIIHLEKELGVKLFDRVGRSLQLNDIGRAYCQYVDDALLSLDNGLTMIRDHLNREQQTVSVAMTSSGVWANLLQDFLTRFSCYNLRQLDSDRQLFHQLLTEQQIDFVLAGMQDIPLKGLRYHLLTEERLYLCVAPSHPLAGTEQVHLQDIRDEAFIMLPKATGFRAFCDDLFRQAGITCHVAAECDYTLRGKMVQAGFGVTITTNIFRINNTLGPDLVYIPIADEFARRPTAIFWNPNHYLSHAARDFLQFVIDRFS